MRSFDPDLIDDEPPLEEFPELDLPTRWHQDSLRRFAGKSLSEVLSASGRLKRLRHDQSACWLLEIERRGSFARWPRQQAHADLLGETCLVHGIRERTSSNLASLGFANLTRLVDHPRFGDSAQRVCELIRKAKTTELAELINQRLSRAHPLHLRLTGLHEDNEFLFLDLETLGLFGGQPIVVAGLAHISASNTLHVRQLVCRKTADEPALLATVSRAVNDSTVLVSFNGRAFDLPFLMQRCNYYGLPLPNTKLHLDLLHLCRRTWGNELGSCRLTVLEQEILGFTRDSDLPGDLVPLYYEQWLTTHNPGFLKLIVDHNRQDVVSLVNLLTKVVEHWAQKSRR